MSAFYKYYDEGEWHTVEAEAWGWVAYYRGGGILRQFNTDNGRFHRFAEIDQTRLIRLEMVPLQDRHQHKVTLPFNPAEDKLIHFYRRGHIAVLIDQDPETGEDRYSHFYFTYYVFGIERDGVKYLHFIDQDGNVHIGDDTVTIAEAEAKRRAQGVA